MKNIAIPTMTTTQYPTRYVGFEHPGVFVEQTHPQHTGISHELAVFCGPNDESQPERFRGVYLDIVEYPTLPRGPRRWLVQADLNNYLRRTAWCTSYEEARALALRWLTDYYLHVEERESC